MEFAGRVFEKRDIVWMLKVGVAVNSRAAMGGPFVMANMESLEANDSKGRASAGERPKGKASNAAQAHYCNVPHENRVIMQGRATQRR